MRAILPDGQVVVGQPDWLDANYPGWVEDTYQPPAAPVAGPPVWEWFIDIGPFLDRFGDAKIMVLVNQDATVQAIIRDLMLRKWVDLKRADVASSLTYIRTKTPALLPSTVTAILETPVADEENRSLRVLYYGGR